MYSTSDLKRGLILEFDGAPHLVETVSVSTPQARGASTLYKVRMRNLKSKQKVDKSFKGGETFGVPDVDRKKVQFLYKDQDSYHFMDQESYEQFPFRKEDLEWEINFLIDDMGDIVAFYYNGHPIALELPSSVVLKIVETNPGVKGNSATGRTKPATLETGFEIQIPEHIDNGVKVQVDTKTGAFQGRVKD
jgi:elongation factor P